MHAQIGKLTAMIILHFHLHLQLKYELFHIHFTSTKWACLLRSRSYSIGVNRTSSGIHPRSFFPNLCRDVAKSGCFPVHQGLQCIFYFCSSNRTSSYGQRWGLWRVWKASGRGTREKRSARACLPCFRREFAIEIICDNRTN